MRLMLEERTTSLSEELSVEKQAAGNLTAQLEEVTAAEMAVRLKAEEDGVAASEEATRLRSEVALLNASREELLSKFDEAREAASAEIEELKTVEIKASTNIEELQASLSARDEELASMRLMLEERTTSLSEELSVEKQELVKLASQRGKRYGSELANTKIFESDFSIQSSLRSTNVDNSDDTRLMHASRSSRSTGKIVRRVTGVGINIVKSLLCVAETLRGKMTEKAQVNANFEDQRSLSGIDQRAESPRWSSERNKAMRQQMEIEPSGSVDVRGPEKIQHNNMGCESGTCEGVLFFDDFT